LRPTERQRDRQTREGGGEEKGGKEGEERGVIS